MESKAIHKKCNLDNHLLFLAIDQALRFITYAMENEKKISDYSRRISDL